MEREAVSCSVALSFTAMDGAGEANDDVGEDGVLGSGARSRPANGNRGRSST